MSQQKAIKVEADTKVAFQELVIEEAARRLLEKLDIETLMEKLKEELLEKTWQLYKKPLHARLENDVQTCIDGLLVAFLEERCDEQAKIGK
jgi:hypothetical protein